MPGPEARVLSIPQPTAEHQPAMVGFPQPPAPPDGSMCSQPRWDLPVRQEPSPGK